MAITNLIKAGFSSTRNYLGGGFKGLFKVGIGTIGLYTELQDRELGTGLSIARGLGYMHPVFGTGLLAWDLTKGIGNAVYANQQSKLKSSFGKGISDPYGNIATMRQRSAYNLNRGRSGLNSEAFLFH